MAAVAWLPDAQNEVFEEDQVTLSALAQIIRQAFYKVSTYEEYLVVHTEGPLVALFVDENKKLISFISSVSVKESAPLELKHAYANELNDTLTLLRFSSPKAHPDSLMANYDLSFEHGIRLSNIVSTLRCFSRNFTHALITHKNDQLFD